mmetsp:Transcript_23928/g.68743  ORF Transcript_23928/g.68743 Transcript_23928/m.68743 type:complete len:331 (-) Transcript_23928:115-1107(-)
MPTSHRQKDDDAIAATDDDGDIEALFADAEAELNAALNKSIKDIERLDDQRPSSEILASVRNGDEYKGSDDGNGDDGGGYSSFGDNDDDELSLDDDIENLEGLAMEDLVRELRDLENMIMLEDEASNGDGVSGKQDTTKRRAPFEGRGRRARARRARIKKEMMAREAKAKRGNVGDAKKEKKEPLKSLGSTSSLGRALAAAAQTKSSEFDNKQGSKSDQGGGLKKGESKTNSVERSEPFQGIGRRARARRAKERREEVADLDQVDLDRAESAKSTGGDAIADKKEEEEEEEEGGGEGSVQTTTAKDTNSAAAEVLKSNSFPDFSIRDALS